MKEVMSVTCETLCPDSLWELQSGHSTELETLFTARGLKTTTCNHPLHTLVRVPQDDPAPSLPAHPGRWSGNSRHNFTVADTVLLSSVPNRLWTGASRVVIYNKRLCQDCHDKFYRDLRTCSALTFLLVSHLFGRTEARTT